MDNSGMTQQQLKVELAGFWEFNRIGSEGWHLKEDFHTSKDGLVSICLDNDVDNSEEEY